VGWDDKEVPGAPKPGYGLADIMVERHHVRLDKRSSLQRHQTKGHHPCRIKDHMQSHQMAAAIDDLAPGWTINTFIDIPQVAEHTVRDKDVAPS